MAPALPSTHLSASIGASNKFFLQSSSLPSDDASCRNPSSEGTRESRFTARNVKALQSTNLKQNVAAISVGANEAHLLRRVGNRENGVRCILKDSAAASVTKVEQKKKEPDKGSLWSWQDSEVLYRVQGWGSPYFFVNPQGRVGVRLSGSTEECDELDLVELIESLKKRNVQLPMVLRFPSIVHHRMKQLQESFDTAILNFGYKSNFQGVFPIKCNHDRYLVEEIVRFGQQYQFGLEAGSKPELLIAMAKLRKSRSALLICNGYKDKVYMETVLLARQLGIKAVVVLEQMEELDLIIKYSKALGVRPMIGVRAKLDTKHDGHWGKTSGHNAKFGLTVNEIVRIVYALRHEDMLDCLRLLHFHIGSQISSISVIKEAMREGSHLYCELARLGAPMGYLDIGGGLGIDYDGTKGQSSSSTNYTIQNYANDVVAALVDACLLKQVSQPVIVSESGRALASHHSVLVFNVLSGSERSEMTALDDMEGLKKYSKSSLGIPTKTFIDTSSGHQKDEYLLSTFQEVYQSVNETNYWEALNDAKQFKLEASSLFKVGCLSLEQLAQADALYEAVCHKVLSHANPRDPPAQLESLQKSVAAVCHVNVSLFRSAPDIWAISQIFPIIPLQRLNEMPTTPATLADLTCDSDGKVEQFVGASGDLTGSLPVHTLREGEPYYIGLFLAGVYQEGMGSAHNMFGTTNTVHVMPKHAKGNGNGSVQSQNGVYAPNGNNGHQYIIDHVIAGQTMAQVLSTMQHDAEDMIEELRREAEKAVADGRLSLDDAQILLHNYKCSLNSYTYLTK